MFSEINLDSFLRFSYCIDHQNPNYNFDFIRIDKKIYSHVSEENLIEEGIRLFRQSIEYNFRQSKKHLVPISGGLDSRAILAGLLEFTSAENIFTYTFGTPSSFDMALMASSGIYPYCSCTS